MNRVPFVFVLFSIFLLAASPAFGDPIFINDILGFEDDVDIVVAPNRQFMVVPEEAEYGWARVKIIKLDPASGEPLDLLYEEDLPDTLGYENGVDPIIIRMQHEAYLIFLPLESENGTHAGIIMLYTDLFGTLMERRYIGLGDLGFREDVDGIWGSYSGSIAFFPLESEDRSVRGVIAFDVSDADNDWGSCHLLSTDGRIGPCDSCTAAPWLPELADGMDPVTYELEDRLRLALPVVTETGCDLLFIDFESDEAAGNIPPSFLPPHRSVKDINAAGPRPLAFPGYECDVDIVYLESGRCGADTCILIPVEGPGDFGDLYRVDQLGVARWVFSMDSGHSTASIPGYEAGVDLLVMCDLGGMNPHRVVVPIENEDGTDADLYIVDIETGALLARAEDPVVNPGLTIPGYEIGVDPVRWTDLVIAVPVEAEGSAPGLVILDNDGTRLNAGFDPDFLGYVRSVDPIVAPLDPPALILPIGTDDGSDADVIVYTDPPNLAVSYSLETVNAPMEMSRFYWDVDLGLVDKYQPGELYLCIPEEAPGGASARLRFEMTMGLPGYRVLAIATAGVGPLPASLYLVDVPTGNIILERNDLLGLETGLDMVTGNGPVTPGEMPVFERETGIDRDADPTLVWEGGIVGIPSIVPKPPRSFLENSYPNPFNPMTVVRYGVERRCRVTLKIYNVAGRLVRTLVNEIQSPQPGGYTVEWNGLDDDGRPVSSGVYFLRLASGDFTATKKAVLLK